MIFQPEARPGRPKLADLSLQAQARRSRQGTRHIIDRSRDLCRGVWCLPRAETAIVRQPPQNLVVVLFLVQLVEEGIDAALSEEAEEALD